MHQVIIYRYQLMKCSWPLTRGVYTVLYSRVDTRRHLGFYIKIKLILYVPQLCHNEKLNIAKTPEEKAKNVIFLASKVRLHIFLANYELRV